MIRTLVFSSLVAIFLVACTRDKIPKDAVFAVGNRYVTQKEFQYRATFTPHPNFPQSNRNLENVFLNNLIMEKIISEEFGPKSELNRNEGFQAYIQGRKEQAMREQLFYKKALDVVSLDKDEIQKTMRLSQREYDLEFFSINKDSIANKIKSRIDAAPHSSLQIFNSLYEGKKRPTWTAKWKDPDHINIHEALYSGPLKADSVIGPLRLDYNQWIIMKVVNWRDVIVIGSEDQDLRRQEVVEKLTMNHATRNWDSYRREVMKGKDIEFDPEMFKKIADLIYDLNRAKEQPQKAETMRRLWQIEDSTLTSSDLPDDKSLLQRPFLTIDGNTWTVGEFRRALMSHPLVYRKTVDNRGQFYFEFRRAVAGLVRDTYLNKEAYQMGLDRDVQVQREAEMWSDAVIASFERNRLLKEVAKAFPDTTDPSRQMKLGKAFNEYLAGLEKKYHNKIRLNTNIFNKIAFSKTQLFVTQQNSPYPVVVPKWPMFNNDNRVDYLPLKPRD
jgi:hypothetical protein